MPGFHVVNAIDPAEFIARVKPALEAKDWDLLLAIIQKHWTSHQVAGLLTCHHVDARKIAALAVGLVGQEDALDALSQILHDDDPMVVEMAEHAMWQIWFRGGGAEANAELARGAEALNTHDLDHAMEHLQTAIELSPHFCEAYNQRAIAHYLAERYAESITDCHRVLEKMPIHFGAWAGLGHCHLARGEVEAALASYEKAIAINPRLECIVELVQELRNHADGGPTQ